MFDKHIEADCILNSLKLKLVKIVQLNKFCVIKNYAQKFSHLYKHVLD